MPKKAADVKDFFLEDWRNIPQNYRYFFLFGFLLIGIVWLKDHWANWHYDIKGFDFGYVLFYGGLLLILSGMVVIIEKQIHTFWIIRNIKKKFPREKLGQTFKLIDTEQSRGKIYLLDLKTNKKYWIASGSTLTDIGFYWGDEVTISKKEFDKYPEGQRILTSGKPGS